MSTDFQLNVEEYDRMIDCGAFNHLRGKIELIRGEIRKMNPAGPIHDDLLEYLTDWSAHTTDRKITRVRVQSGLSLSNLRSRPEPDLMWVKAIRYRHRHPAAEDVQLAIEVSDSSLNSDLIEKSALYAEAGIVEYWIVDAANRCVHVFRDPQAGEYPTRYITKDGDHLSPLAASHTPLDLQDLFE